MAHQGEFPSIGMRAAMEPLLLQYGVDLVFSGHVHAYERTAPVALNQVPIGGSMTVDRRNTMIDFLSIISHFSNQ